MGQGSRPHKGSVPRGITIRGVDITDNIDEVELFLQFAFGDAEESQTILHAFQMGVCLMGGTEPSFGYLLASWEVVPAPAKEKRLASFARGTVALTNLTFQRRRSITWSMTSGE